MRFNEHSELAGLHAFLSPSNYHWMNYDLEKLERVYRTSQAARHGTELHAFASEAIRLGIKLRGSNTIAAYVNDAIGYRMTPEQTLFYSENCFGHADAISFRRGQLRIHDLKSGVTKSSVHQLEVYAALFCLEYKVKPAEIQIELRIYQNDEVQIYEGDPDVITHIMDTIITFDAKIESIRMEELA